MWMHTFLLLLVLLAWKPVAAAARPLGLNESTLVGYLWVTTVVLVAMRRRVVTIAELVGPVRAGDAAWGALAGVLLFVLGVFGYAITQRVTGARLPQEATAFFDVASPRTALLVASITGLAVAAEEIAFRGLLLRDLSAQLPVAAAVVISAALFAAFHMSMLQAASTFVLGIGLAWLVLSRGSLIPALAAHAVYNGLGIGLALLTRR